MAGLTDAADPWQDRPASAARRWGGAAAVVSRRSDTRRGMRVASGARGLLLVLAVLAAPVGAARAQEPEPAPGAGGRAGPWCSGSSSPRSPSRPAASSARTTSGSAPPSTPSPRRRRANAASPARSTSASAPTRPATSAAVRATRTFFGLRAGARLGGGGYRSRVRLLGDMRALIHDNVLRAGLQPGAARLRPPAHRPPRGLRVHRALLGRRHEHRLALRDRGAG